MAEFQEERRETQKRTEESKATAPYWLEDERDERMRNFRSTADLPTEVQDVVIIGGGMTGVSAAYHCMLQLYELESLTQSFRCLLLEKGCLSAGATGRNGGFICPGTSEKYSESCARYGKEKTKKLFDYTVAGTEAVKEFMERVDGDNGCEMRFGGAVSLALTDPELENLKESFLFMTENNLNVQWWDEDVCFEKTKSRNYKGGLFKPYGGNLWAAKVVFAAANEAITLESKINVKQPSNDLCASLNIQTHTSVTAVKTHDNDNNIIAVHTERGVILTRKILHATNAWCRSLLPQIQDLVTPVRNQVIITEPMPPMWTFGLSANFGYEYFMQRPDGRIVLGGMRDLSPTMEENCSDEDILDMRISNSLRSYLSKHFPDHLSEIGIEKEWIGILAFTPDRNPIVGALAGVDYKNQYIACGYTGHGMPLAFLVGKHIMKMMLESTTRILGETEDVDKSEIPNAYLPSRFHV